MIKSREELLALSSEWATMAKNDLRNQLIGFMEQMRTNEDELAYALGISSGELMQIIEGNGEVSLSTFAKILIATDNVIEIKPLAAMGGNMRMPRGVNCRTVAPQSRYNAPAGQTPNRQRRDVPQSRQDIPVDAQGRPMMPPMDAQGRPMYGGMPGMPSGDRFGGMPGMGRKMSQRQEPTMNENFPLGSLTRSQLVEEIERNFWDSEIDIRRASREELAAFLSSKVAPQATPTLTQRERKPQMVNSPQNVGVEAVDPTEDFLNMLKEQFATNPHLREEISKYLPQRG